MATLKPCWRARAQSLVWGLLDQAESLLPLGRTEPALALLEDVLRLLPSNVGRAEEIWTLGLHAVGLWRRGDLEGALRSAEKGLGIARSTLPTSVYTLDGYAGIAEVLLAGAATPGQNKNLHRARWQRARDSCSELRRFARAIPVARPRLALCLGHLSRQRGRVSNAVRWYRRALTAARSYAMPYEGALALLELAILLPPGPERDEQARSAEAALRALDAQWDLQRGREAGAW